MKSERKIRTENFQLIVAEPECIDHICDAIGEGQMLWDWAKRNNIPYRHLHEWIHRDHERLAKYAEAMESRNSAIQDRVMSALMDIGESDLIDCFDKNGELKPLKDIPEKARKAIAGIDRSVDKDGRVTTKIRTNPRERGLELAGKTVGMFRDKLEVTVNVGFADRLKAARARTGITIEGEKVD